MLLLFGNTIIHMIEVRPNNILSLYYCVLISSSAQWYSTWLSQRDARNVPYDGMKVLGDGEEIIDDLDGTGCMGMRPFYEMSYRGHANQFIGLYIEDPNCGETESTLPPFVKCSGPGAIIPDDGASCTCGDNRPVSNFIPKKNRIF